MKKIPDASGQINFSCGMCGNSCKTFIVNITPFDVKRIVDNRPDLKPNDFQEYYDVEEESQAGLDFGMFSKKIPVLKKKSDGSCIFLDEKNLCSINDIKPLTCRTFPFRLENNLPVWEEKYYPFLRTKCAFSLNPAGSDPETLVAELQAKEMFNQEFARQQFVFNLRQEQKYTDELKALLKPLLDQAGKVTEYTSLQMRITDDNGYNEFYQVEIIEPASLKVPADSENLFIFNHPLDRSAEPEAVLKKLEEFPAGTKFVFIVKNCLNPFFLKELFNDSSFKLGSQYRKRALNFFSRPGLENLFKKTNLMVKDFWRHTRNYSQNLADWEQTVLPALLPVVNLELYETEKHTYSLVYFLEKGP